MGGFLAKRIIDGFLNYTVAIMKRPDLKTGIDEYLTKEDRTDLIAA